MTEDYTILVNEQERMPVVRLEPCNSGPLLVMVPSIFGIGPDVVEYAVAFASAGGLVYVLDPFWRFSPGPLPIPTGSSQAMKRMREVDTNQVLTDLLTAIDAGRREVLCNGDVILLGICFGGQFVVQAAQEVGVQGLATWHGGNLLSVLEPSMLNKVQIEMDFGEADPLIPLSEVNSIKEMFRNHPNIQIRTHKMSGHGFTHTGTVKHNANAAQQSQGSVVQLIQRFR